MAFPIQSPGSAWLAIVNRPSCDSFARAFTGDAILEATVLSAPLRGAREIHRFFVATRSMYERIEFLHETRSGSRVCLEWSGRFEGSDISGATLIAHDAEGLVASIRLYHFPLTQLVAFANTLASKLVQQS